MTITILKNPLRGSGLSSEAGMAAGTIETDAGAARALYALCPVAMETPLIDADGLAKEIGVAELHLKDERQRMGLGSFKALGATYAIAKMAAARADAHDAAAMKTALEGVTFVCASAGNHGLSMAAGARLFGAKAVVYLADTVPENFAEKLRSKDSIVIREGDDYEASLEAAEKAAEGNGWFLLADGTWEGYSDPARDVMEGYLIMGHEAADQAATAPTHVFLQAGVGGLAAGMGAAVRTRWGNDVHIIIVEPEAAPALIESVKADKVVDTTGPVSTMGRLDCKTPSHLALKYLALEADTFLTIDDDSVSESIEYLKETGIATTPSGGAGIAALHHLGHQKEELGIGESSRVLCIISEEA